MKWKKYKYTAQLGPGGSVTYRPLLSVRIATETYPPGRDVLAIIDSGTDSTVFNADIARALGVDPRDCRKIRMGGIGVVDGFLCDVKIVIPDFDLSMNVSVAFLENPPFDALLGQRDFFERFKVLFEKDQQQFKLALV